MEKSAPKLNIRSFKKEKHKLTVEQAAFVKQFVQDYNAKTIKSKTYAAANRDTFCDWINTLCFKMSLKDFIYPIVSESSFGSKFKDIDGNEYVDMAMGYGVAFHGHNPPYVKKAIESQLEKGIELGPQCRLSAETAVLVKELTGVERVTFCCTGTEAVMAALRIARAATNRQKVVMFRNSFHGSFDGVLAWDFKGQSFPLADGTLSGMVEDIIVLPYASEESMDFIKTHIDELAAVLVEPIQSRTPELQPIAFLRALRQLTRSHGAALIFDETVTGFRVHPGGVQALFNIKADLVIYGKSLGGGMPISAVCGTSSFMDVVDGGSWLFEDDSFPKRDAIFFTGTYFKHPLSIAAAKAALMEIKENGTALQDRASKVTADLAAALNLYFQKDNVPIVVNAFGSMFRFVSIDPYPLMAEPIEMDLFFYQLLYRGVYTWERRICYLSAVHTEQDVVAIMQAVKESVAAIRDGGFEFKS